MIKKILVPILKICKSKFIKIEDPRFANREAEQIGTKLTGQNFENKQWQKSAAQKFQEETEIEKARKKEEEARRKASIEEDRWQEVKLPEGTERNPE